MSVDPPAGPGPEEAPPLPHVEPDRLADLAEGLLDAAAEAEVRAHLAACGACAEDYALIADSFELAELLPPEPIPAEVLARVTAALEREPALVPQSTAAGSPTLTPGADDTTAVPDRTAARPRRHRFRLAFGGLAAAAALSAVVVGGISVLRSSTATRGSTASGAAAAGPDAAVNPAQGGAAVPPKGAPAVDDAAAAQQDALSLLRIHPLSDLPTRAADSGGLSSTPVFAGCVPGPQSAQTPLATEQISFQGRPAWLLVYRQSADPTQADVIVVPAACVTGSQPAAPNVPSAAAAATAPLLRTTVRIP